MNFLILEQSFVMTSTGAPAPDSEKRGKEIHDMFTFRLIYHEFTMDKGVFENQEG